MSMGETVILRPGPGFDTDGVLAESGAPAEFEALALGVAPLGEALAQSAGRDGAETGHTLYLPPGTPVEPGMEAQVRGAWHVVRSVSEWASPIGSPLGGLVAHVQRRQG
jgi:hypothetical protein